MFASGAEKMFALFPIEAGRAVADPASGYPSTERFAPTLAGLRIALEEAARPAMLKREREARERAFAEQRAAERAEASGRARPTRSCSAGAPRRASSSGPTRTPCLRRGSRGRAGAPAVRHLEGSLGRGPASERPMNEPLAIAITEATPGHG